jgi:hypothetical protein
MKIFYLDTEPLGVGRAVRLQEDEDVRGSVSVIDVRIQILELARQRVREEVLSNQLPALGNPIVARVIRVHGAVHAPDEVGERHRLSNMGLRFEELLGPPEPPRCDRPGKQSR